jgi:hypothetical protein
VVDVDDDHLPLRLVDPVTNPVFPTPRAPETHERCAKGNADGPRLLCKRTDDELPRGEGGRCGK